MVFKYLIKCVSNYLKNYLIFKKENPFYDL